MSEQLSSPESPPPKIVLTPIGREFEWGSIEGYHLLPSELNENRQGDGWLAVDIKDGKLLICVIDISLAGVRVMGRDGRSITEARLLLDATETMKTYTEEHSSAITPFDLLNMMTRFDPSYLKPWEHAV